jgi:hypothetical protein
MVFRHMSLICAVLPRTAMEPRMRADTVVVEENFYNVACYTYIDFMFDVFVWDRIVHFIDRYVIIELHGGYFPSGQLIWGGR